MKRLTTLEIPGGKLGLYVDLERAILTDLEIHTSAKIRVRLERQTRGWYHIHLYRRSRCIRTWDVVIGMSGEVDVKTTHQDSVALEKYAYGAHRQRKNKGGCGCHLRPNGELLRCAKHQLVLTPGSPEGELKAQAVQP